MTEKAYIEKLHSLSRDTGFLKTGDDAAIIPKSNIISTDQFIEGTHFLWSHMSAQKLGFKSIVQALSDLAAMGAQPTACLLSMAWNDKHSEYIIPYLDGVKEACIEYDVPLVGGDITKSPNTFYSDITVCGWTDSPLEKSGAKVGDLLVVTGPMGNARAGLEQIAEKDFSPALRQSYERPTAQIKKVLNILNEIKIHAATDISDSLSKSVYSMLNASMVGAELDSDLIPISEDLKKYAFDLDKNIEDYKWNSGEDYHLLLAVPKNTPSSLLTDHGLTVIGRVHQEMSVRVKIKNKIESLTEVGWDPFAL